MFTILLALSVLSFGVKIVRLSPQLALPPLTTPSTRPDVIFNSYTPKEGNIDNSRSDRFGPPYFDDSSDDHGDDFRNGQPYDDRMRYGYNYPNVYPNRSSDSPFSRGTSNLDRDQDRFTTRRPYNPNDPYVGDRGLSDRYPNDRFPGQYNISSFNEDRYRYEQERRSQIEMEKLRNFLAETEHQGSLECSANVAAQWNFETNVNGITQTEALFAQQRYAEYQHLVADQTKRINPDLIFDRKLYRQLQLFSEAGANALPFDQLDRYNRLVNEMLILYNDATICAYEQPFQCGLRYHPELRNIMASSRDWGELEYTWTEYHRKAGREMRDNYKQLIDVMNEISMANNVTNGGDYWYMAYESGSFREDLEIVWEEIRPFYELLHAYVRRKLREYYGPERLSRIAPIPTHILGNMFGQNWINILDIIIPYPGRTIIDVTPRMIELGYTPVTMYQQAEEFFTSINFTTLGPQFYANSIFEQPIDRPILCEPSAWDFCNRHDYRIKMCATVDQKSFLSVHHELAHIHYFLQYRHQPRVFRNGANPAFHQAVGDAISLSVSTLKHLQTIGLIQRSIDDYSYDINYLFTMALDKIAFLPFALAMDNWRYDLFSGRTRKSTINCHFWDLRERYGGVKPPSLRSEKDFDAGAKYHIPANIPYINSRRTYSFLATVIPQKVFESIQAKTTTGASARFTFSFASSLSSAGDTSTTASKPLFSGFAKPTTIPITTSTAPALEPVVAPPAIKTDTVPEVAVVESKPDSPEASTDSTGFTFSSLNLGTLGLSATPNLSATPSVSTIDSGSPSSAATVKTTSASVSDPTDSVFGNLNICKPTSTENAGAFKSSFAGGNLFGAASFGTDSNPDMKSIFGTTLTSKESTDTDPAAVNSTATDTGKSVFETSSTDTNAAVSTPSTTITSTPSIFAPKATQSQSFTFGTPSIATTSSSIVTGQVAATTSAPPSLFATPATGASIFASAATATTTPASTTTLAGGPLFGGTGISFGTPTSQAPPPIFGTATTIPSATQATSVSPFAPVASTPATLFGTPTTTSTSIFGSAATATTPAVSSTTGNIFGGIPKPDQSAFGQTESNVFGAPNTDKSISGGNFFGGQGTAFGGQSATNTTGSIFGGSSPGTAQISSPFAANSNSGTNIFGSPTSGAGTNVFASPTQSAASGGSIFDQSAGTVQSGGSIFGGGATQPFFGTSNSPFAGNTASGGSSTSPKSSVFGSPTAAPSVFGSTGTSGFGLFSQTPAFGSPTQPVANTGGSFAQGGSSITQQGFGSPGATAFNKPVFGGEPTFGSAPTFGSPPSFGSAPSFGSPKGFGSFAAPAASGGAFTSPTQENNLFEALGSSDTGLSFGNLAQNTNTNQQKPAFGGSSFMSYRS